MITSLGIENFKQDINEIERNIDAGTSFHLTTLFVAMTKTQRRFAVAGYRR